MHQAVHTIVNTLICNTHEIKTFVPFTLTSNHENLTVSEWKEFAVINKTQKHILLPERRNLFAFIAYQDIKYFCLFICINHIIIFKAINWTPSPNANVGPAIYWIRSIVGQRNAIWAIPNISENFSMPDQTLIKLIHTNLLL